MHGLKSGSFGFARVSACEVEVKPNVLPTAFGMRLAKIVFKKVRWEKIKIQKRWLLGWLSDDSFVLSFVYVLLCRSFLLCSYLGLQVTFCSYKKLAITKP